MACNESNHSNKSSSPEMYLIIWLAFPLSTVIILANLLIIIGIIYNRKLHNTPNYFFLSLLFADLCTGLALPFIPSMSLERHMKFSNCLILHIVPNFLLLSFLFNLVMVHYERYFCIVHPLQYSNFWVHRYVPLALLTVWILPLLYASLPAFGWNKISPNQSCEDCFYKYIFPREFIYLEVYGLLIPAILAIIFMNVRVLWITRSQVMDICKLHRSVQRDEPSDKEHRMNMRYAKCVAVVSFIFIVCWVPYIVYVNVSIIALWESSTEPKTHIILSCTGIGSMAVIPVVLGFGNRQYTKPIRKGLRKLWDRCRKGNGTKDVTNVELVLD
ncbi:G-protein coupled bile acid receptor 1 [Acipenser ruthenus]|uniref:G-protein coupled bile acid receptor 1 n=1 Tax=Acipenser ruthenus TaxID=7906 RepID=A0A444UDF5_ACIRT|nr:G-protein coupled bile acid receptor 1-like [Acipenser ruthenus]RXM33189.1 G-protein coupled bile acid receptor 1 [Acipenser ruthenus]